jgi:hypothetical protein
MYFYTNYYCGNYYYSSSTQSIYGSDSCACSSVTLGGEVYSFQVNCANEPPPTCTSILNLSAAAIAGVAIAIIFSCGCMISVIVYFCCYGSVTAALLLFKKILLQPIPSSSSSPHPNPQQVELSAVESLPAKEKDPRIRSHV